MSKFFPLLGGGGPSEKNLFSSLNMYQAKSGVKIFPFTGGGGSLCENFFSSLNMYQAKSGVKNFSLYCGWGTPSPGWDRNPPPYVKGWIRTPPPSKAGSGTPLPRLDRDPPPLPNVNRLKLLPSPILRMAGGNNCH